MSKVRYQLLRAKTGNYKDPKSLPALKTIDVDGEKKQIQDMEVICTDYPLKMPIILYNNQLPGDVVAGQPYLVYKGDLYAVYNFTQVSKDIINIFVMYAGDPNQLPVCQK